jgi:hypothetical protein
VALLPTQEPSEKKRYKIRVPANKQEAREILGEDTDELESDASEEANYSVVDKAGKEGRDLTRKILRYLKPPGFEKAPAMPGSKPSPDEELDY